MISTVSGGAVSGASIQSVGSVAKKVTASPSPTFTVANSDDSREGNRVSSGSSIIYLAPISASTPAPVATGSSVMVEDLGYIRNTIERWNSLLIILVISVLFFVVYKFFNIFF